MIVYGNELEGEETEMRSKETITSANAADSLPKKIKTENHLPYNELETTSKCKEDTFNFVPFSLLKSDYQKWLYYNIQTVGKIRVNNGNLMLLSLNGTDCIKLSFHSQALNSLTNYQKYAHIFGYIVNNLPNDNRIVLKVINLIELDNFVNAQRLECNLCNINKMYNNRLMNT